MLSVGSVWGARRGHRWLAVGWFWYLGTLLPTIGLVQVGAQVMADRFLYLPQIGLCVAVVWGVAHLTGAWPYRRWLFAAVAALVVAGLMVLAWQQTRYWRGSETLWTHSLACTSKNYVAHNNLGRTLSDRGQVAEAIAHYQKALEFEPKLAGAHNNFGRALADRGQIDEAVAHYQEALAIEPKLAGAHINLGDLLTRRGQVNEAITHYRKALEIKPDNAETHNNLGLALSGRGRVNEAIVHYRKALEIEPDNAEAHYNLGNALTRRGQVDEAIAHYRKALEIKPNLAEAHNNLSMALAGRGRLDEAIIHYRKALEIKPNLAEAHDNLGMALAGRGQIDEAMVHFQKVLEIKPDDAVALNSMAWFRATHPDPKFRDGAQALILARRAAELTGNDPQILDTLAAAYAEAGRFPEAIATAGEAISLARSAKQSALADSIQSRLDLYRAGQPYRESSPKSTRKPSPSAGP